MKRSLIRILTGIAGLALAGVLATPVAAEPRSPRDWDPPFRIADRFEEARCGLQPGEAQRLQRDIAAITDLVLECDKLASEPRGQRADEHLARWLEIQSRVTRVERSLESTRISTGVAEPLEQTAREIDRASSAATGELEREGVIRDRGAYANVLADVYTLAQELSHGVDELGLCGPLARGR